jgi:hypothetical protein
MAEDIEPGHQVPAFVFLGARNENPPPSGGPRSLDNFLDTVAADRQASPRDPPWQAVPNFEYADESDPGPNPLLPDAPIEGGSQSTGDRHALVVGRDNCILYETFSSYPQSDGGWQAGSGAVFNLRSTLPWGDDSV